MINVEVIWTEDQGPVHERTVQLPSGACVQDALAVCGLTLTAQQSCGIWGRVHSQEHALQTGDRVEVYQPLKVDPKFARRERFSQQGARGAGLFAKRRINSKSGY